jgi:hypothetical protein
VGLIQDEDFEAITSWSKNCSFSKVSGIIYTVVRGSINFNYIQRTRTTLCQLNTAVTLSAWRISWSLCAIQAASKDSGGSCLAAASWT